MLYKFIKIYNSRPFAYDLVLLYGVHMPSWYYAQDFLLHTKDTFTDNANATCD